MLNELIFKNSKKRQQHSPSALLSLSVALSFIFAHHHSLAQDLSLFCNIERTLIDSSLKSPEAEEIKLVSGKELIYLVDFRNISSKNDSITVTAFDENLHRVKQLNYFSLSDNFLEVNSIYGLDDVKIRGDSLYVLFSQNLFIFFDAEMPPFEVELPTDCSKLELYEHGVALFLNYNPSTLSAKDQGRAYYLSEKFELTELKQFQHEAMYLSYFNRPNYYEVWDGKILYLYAEKPSLLVFDPQTDSLTTIIFRDTATWTSFESKKAAQLNKLAEKDRPHKVFSDVSPYLQKYLSYNLRIDQVDSSKYLITYSPGEKISEEDFQLDQLLLTFEEDESCSISETFSHNFFTDYYGVEFNFHNNNKHPFCYLNGIRYQLVVEPHASWHDRDSERIKKEQNQSLIYDKYDLCIYSGKVR